MSEPSVTAIMLVNGRHEMVARAVRSFMAQSYPREKLRLLIWDTGEPHYAPPFVYGGIGVEVWHRKSGQSIGALRNEAIARARGEIIVTFDSDDYSGPNRIAEQVALLQSGDYDAVGYKQMLFWKDEPGEAWLYTHGRADYCLGTSLCYWRRVWQQKPFGDLPQPGNPQSACEDYVWQSGLLCKSVSAIGDDGEPRMIATVHGANSRTKITPHNDVWQRTPEWDERVRRIMAQL